LLPVVAAQLQLLEVDQGAAAARAACFITALKHQRRQTGQQSR
jgi:organic hydroperoxide reductase OsmC/OhrA